MLDSCSPAFYSSLALRQSEWLDDKIHRMGRPFLTLVLTSSLYSPLACHHSSFVTRTSSFAFRHSSIVNTAARVSEAGKEWQNGFVGSDTCVPCHRPQAQRQLASNMARTAFRPGDHPLFLKFRNEAARVMGLRILFLWEEGPFRISISDDKRELHVPVHWALGAGVHAVTFFSRLEQGKYLESLLTYYSKTGTLDFTPGQGESKLETLQEAAGRVNERPEAYRCLFCHTTGSRDAPEMVDVEVGELGVRCEACHGPGMLHLETVRAQKWNEMRRTIKNPRHYTASQVLEDCGACHREPPKEPLRVNWKDPANARFQPIGLSQSRCFQKSNGTLSCLTCHDAHSNARRDPDYYSRVCIGCHTSSRLSQAPVCRSQRREGCASCHMPRVHAIRQLEFSNHWIGIYSQSDRLVPVSRRRS